MRPDDSSDNPIAQFPSTDAELDQALKAGQKSALDRLYDQYGKLVYGLALKILKHPQEAEDLTQEIFLALWRTRNYDPNRGSLSSFLMTVTRSRAIDKIRSRNTSLKLIDRWSQTMPPQISSNTPFDQASFAERSQQVRNALGQLSTEQRQVLKMGYYEGLSQAEIAQRLKLPLGTVKTRVRMGLLKLRTSLQDFMG